MSEVFGRATSVRKQVGRERLRWYSAYIGLMVVGMMLAVLASRRAPGVFSIAVAALLLTALAWMAKPIVGMHLILLFTLFGDYVTISWFPFAKNLSSVESLLFVSNQLTISPLECTLGFASVCLLLRHLARHEHPVVIGPLLRPLLIFTGFVFFGLLYGLSSGGDMRVAVYEARGLLYIPIVYFLVSNTCRTARQYRGLLWTAMVGILGNSIMSLIYLAKLTSDERKNLEALGEHGAALSMNALFILAISSFLFKRASGGGRLLLLAMCVPAGWAYLASQRRAAVIGLSAALFLLAIVLFWHQRSRFWRVVPVAVLAFTAYLGVFWNSSASFGFPAQAVKTVIAPGSLSDRDRGSDLYRQIENYDLNSTIRQAPITGLGFGHPFSQPVALPDISFYEFYRYIPHNSVLWIWIQTGFFGFVSMFFLFGRAMALAGQKLRRLTNPDDVILVVVGGAFVLMYAIFAYVDIAWDARGTVFLGFAFAICANFPIREPTADRSPAIPVAASLDVTGHQHIR
jgi:O-antigen ligase